MTAHLSETAMSLTMVVPALNEEEAIENTLRRCLTARAALIREAHLGRVSVVAVSDGSTDRTAEIARSVEGVEVVVFPRNRGYGAAIKAGWDHAPADLLAFIDADGTCDPLQFVPMCSLLIRDDLDMVLGNRMGSASRMPWIRRLGNVIFAHLLGHLSGRRVRDTASGMRVLRSRALHRLLPLPDGLHFTPAMSARALVDGDVRVGEMEMPYEERIGRSKLAVVRDGLRFLRVILSATAYVRLSRLTLPLIVAGGAAAAALLSGPSVFYVMHGELEEWMFYRITLALTLSTMALSLLCSTIIAEHVSALARFGYHEFEPETRGVWRYQTLQVLVGIVTGLGVVGVLLNVEGVRQFLSSGQVTLHWSRVILGAFFGINLVLLMSTLGVLKVVRALHSRQPYVKASAPESRRVVVERVAS